MNISDLSQTMGTMNKRLCLLGAIIGMALISTVQVNAQGPVQPEAMQFEPVDVTDVVNLATGDFVYTIPVMNVPGPAGDYPITMSYHSRIGPNQPATWVGLGWTLNAGAVNRTLSGYPDDYKGDMVVTEYEAPSQSGSSINIGMGWGPIGMNMSYDQEAGKVGVNAMVSLSTSMVPGLENSPISGGINASYGTGGFSASASISHRQNLGNGFNSNVSLSAGANGVGIDGSGNVGMLNVSNDGVSIAARYKSISVGASITSQGLGGNFSVAGTGFSTSSQTTGGGVEVKGNSIKIPLPANAWISLGYSTWKWSLDESFEEESYGSLYQIDNYGSNNGVKNERHATEETLFPSVDAYNVAAQGVGGVMQPVFDHSFELIDNVDNDEKGYLDLQYSNSSFDPNTQVNFRFLDDPALNFTNKGVLQLSTARNFSRIDQNQYSSKKVDPIISSESGRLIGYIITKPDGMVYEFMQPVYNYFQYSESVSLDQNAEVNFTNKNSLLGTYSTSWFLTAIKGPDYIDRGTTGTVDDQDWGYWVKFNYDISNDLQIWSTPHNAVDPVFDYALGSTTNSRNFSAGIREVVYLSSIETKTHRADFVTSTSKNGINSTTDFSQFDYEPISYSLNNSTSHSFKIIGDVTRYLNQIGTGEDILKVKHTFNDYGYLIECSSSNYTKSELSYTYDQQQGITNITVNNPTAPTCSIPNSTYVDSKANVLLIKFLDSTASTQVKLDAVELINKDYPSSVISKASFDFDYSLRPNTPASFATTSDGANKGALTLNSVKFYGQNNTLVSPPYRFDYGYGGSPGSSYNPTYNKEHYDFWGSYRKSEEAWLEHRHTPIQKKGAADLAAAWSLTSIQMPTGSTINIEYEADDFFYINDTYFLSEGEKFSIDKSNSNGTSIKINGVFPNGKQTKAIIIEKTEYDISVIDYYYYTTQPPTPVYKTETLSQYESLGLYNIDDLNSSSKIVTLDQAPTLNSASGYTYILMTVPNTVYGGGSRVKSVTTIDGNEQTQTLYLYKDGNVSSGVTSSLPADFVIYDAENIFSDDSYEDEFGYDDVDGSILEEIYKEVFMDHKASYGRPNPGVMYSKVQVVNVDENLNPISGQTEYEFYTSKDFPYKPDYSDNHFYIKDLSGMYGKPKATTYYEQVEVNGAIDFRPLKRTSNLFAYSDQLFDSAKIFTDETTIVTDTNKPLGVTQQKHVSYVAIEDEGASNDFNRIVERTYMNVFGTGQSSVEYFYDGTNSTNELTPTSHLSQKGKTIAYDANTGSALISAQQSSDDSELVITKSVPAYWKYSGMESKHMLTQLFQEIAYRTTGDIEANNLKDISLIDNDIKSSSITTWSNVWPGDANGVWRKNDTYAYVTDLTYQGFSAGNLNNVSTTYPTVSSSSPWKMTSNINRYDTFGHATETVNEDGTYQAVLYDPGNQSLVLAVASNAMENEIIYDNFETGSSTTNAYTGQRSVTTFSVTTPANDPIHATKYKVGVWVKGSGATVNGVAVPGRNNSSWVFYEVLVDNNTNVGGSSGYFDDVTVIPEYASISYFAYDALTWKVTAMTGPDHRTSFYEYDDAGRLIGVRDQDGKLLQSNEYVYGQDFYISTDEGQFAAFDEVTFNLETVGASVAASTPYTWSFGNGIKYQTSGTTASHAFSESGVYTVSVSFNDANNYTRRTNRTVHILGDLDADLTLFSVVNYGGANGDYYVVNVLSDVEGGAEPYSYEWYVQDYNDDPMVWERVSGQKGPNAEIQWLVSNTTHTEPFRIKLEVTDNLNTVHEATITINKAESFE